MIVLDAADLKSANDKCIQDWYRGKIVTIAELRPGTVILDDTIPALLKALFRKPEFKNRKQRTGHVFRITSDGTTQFYNWNNREMRRLQV